MSIASNIATFRHGVHPEEYKGLTESKPIERMPFASELVLPLGQHIGAPARAIVAKGDRVQRGQMIGEPTGFVSVALHSPVDGTVLGIELSETITGAMVPAIRIQTDPYSPQLLRTELPPVPEALTTPEFIQSIQSAGIVGLGGAAFPAHVKFAIPEGKTCSYLVLNGCECEPFLTSDHRTMVEEADAILDGTMILNSFVKASKVYIGIEANKPDAIQILRDRISADKLPIEVISLQVKYPQGAEKMLITAIEKLEVPSGKLPIDLEFMVSNVSTIGAISHWFRKGMPLIERVVTISGSAINRPANVRIPIGTPMKDVVEFCGGIKSRDLSSVRMLLGGPMMGMVQKTLNTPVVKGTSGMLFLEQEHVSSLDQYNCIKCGKCVEACPMFLNPSILGILAKKGLWADMEDHHVLDCFECGSCSFICPSGIPLVQSFRVAKGIIRERNSKK